VPTPQTKVEGVTKMDELKSLLAEVLASGEATATDLHKIVTEVRKELKEQGKLPKISKPRKLSYEAQLKKAQRRLKTIAKEIRKYNAQIKRARENIKKWKSIVQELKREREDIKAMFNL